MLDWKKIPNKRNIFTLTLGLVALVGSFAVLGMTILRVQNLKPTVDMPKAECFGWDKNGNCTKYDNESSSGCSAPVPSCCSNIKGSNFFACSWDGATSGGSRGWCTLSQCGGPPTRSGNQNCGLFRQSYCKAGSPCSSNEQCAAGFACNNSVCQAVQTGKALNPSPIDGEIGVDTKVTLTWAIADQGTTGAYVNVYMWSCAAKTEDCLVFASATQTKTYIPITNFYKPTDKGANFQAGSWGGNGNPDYYVGSLKSNTQYWWVVTPGVNGGVQYYGDTWTFKTGNDTVTEVCWDGVDNNNNGQIDENCACYVNEDCPSTGDYVCLDTHVCVIQSSAHLGCGSNNTCVYKNGAGNNTEGCATYSGACTSTCTYDSDCGTGKVCAQGSCVDPSQSHLVCGNNNTCIRAAGAGNNLNGCTGVGNSCTTVTCTSPLINCNGSCVNPNTDNNNCNYCGNACTGGQTCNSGVCGSTCTYPLIKCGSSCVNTQTDVNNCGGCGTTCSSTQTCTNSACVSKCGAGLTVCGSNCCTSTQTCNTDANVCVTPSGCQNDQQCAPYVCVQGSCVDPAQTHLACTTTGACTHVIGVGNNANGCTTAGQNH